MILPLRVLKDFRFWVNYALILVVTCWIPLLSQTAVMTQSDGKEVSRTTSTVRVYRSWWALATHGPDRANGRAVAIHAGLSFIIAFSVWSMSAQRRPETPGLESETTEAGPEEAGTPEDNTRPPDA